MNIKSCIFLVFYCIFLLHCSTGQEFGIKEITPIDNDNILTISTNQDSKNDLSIQKINIKNNSIEWENNFLFKDTVFNNIFINQKVKHYYSNDNLFIYRYYITMEEDSRKTYLAN